MPPNNRKAVWYNPRDDKGDRVLYYSIESRQTDHNKQELLSPHPLADSDPNYEGLVFLNREPAKDGAFARDWYGPLSLIDDTIRVSTVGSGYQSALLYARGSEPPTIDQRVPIKDRQVAEHTFIWSWALDPDTSLAGPDFIELTTAGTMTGDEVYLDIADVVDIPGIESGTFQIARHINANTIHIAVPYDSTVTPLDVVTGITFEACYILDGYSDSEGAPGVLNGLFHVRSFTYRLATPSDSYQWDETLGLKLKQETRAVPSTWATLWQTGYPTAATSDQETSTGYQAVSKLVHNRVVSTADGSPSEDGIIWPGMTRVSVPAICQVISVPWVWAQAEQGDYLSYDEDWGVAQDVWGPGQVSAVTQTHRKIAKTADVNTTLGDYLTYLTSPGSDPDDPLAPLLANGTLFSFEPESYALRIGSWMAHSGDNVWTRAKIRPFSVGPFLLSNNTLSFNIPVSAGPVSGGNENVDGGTVTFTPTTPVPWGTLVLWDVSVTRARWGYWIIDFTLLGLPGDPSL